MGLNSGLARGLNDGLTRILTTTDDAATRILRARWRSEDNDALGVILMGKIKGVPLDGLTLLVSLRHPGDAFALSPGGSMVVLPALERDHLVELVTGGESVVGSLTFSLDKAKG
jgi:hypothetical protein